MKESRSVAAKWFSKNGYESISPLDFYRAIFPADELAAYTDQPRSAEANQEWKYNAILLENTHKQKTVRKKDPRSGRYETTEKAIWRNYIVLDDLDRIQKAVDQFGQTESEFFIAPMSYLGRRRNKQQERWIYACILEVDHPKTGIIDGRREQIGLKQLVHDWTESSIAYLMPSACVCSGNGLHLIYLLDRPYQISDEYQKDQWDNFRNRFTDRIWNRLVTNAPKQYENHCQSFRVVGTRTKKGQRVEAFWLSKKRYTIDELFSQVDFDDVPTWQTFEEFIEIEKTGLLKGCVYEPDDLMKQPKKRMPKLDKDDRLSPGLQLAREKYGEDWYQRRIVEKQPPKQPGQWTAHRGLYDWFLRSAKVNPYEGSRYNRIHALAEYAVKCGISYDEFKADAFELYEIFKSINATDPFRYLEFVKARDEYFNVIAHKSTRDWIEKNTGVPMAPSAPRNGNKQYDHLQKEFLINPKTKRRYRNPCKDNREIALEDMRANGMITGRPNKQDQVEAWQLEHPGCSKADCARDTGLDPKTIRRWWKG